MYGYNRPFGNEGWSPPIPEEPRALGWGVTGFGNMSGMLPFSFSFLRGKPPGAAQIPQGTPTVLAPMNGVAGQMGHPAWQQPDLQSRFSALGALPGLSQYWDQSANMRRGGYS